MDPVERLESDEAGERAVADDGEGGAAVLGEPATRQPDERARPLEILAGRPRQPCAQVRAIAVDQREQRVGIGFLEPPELAAAGGLEAASGRASLRPPR